MKLILSIDNVCSAENIPCDEEIESWVSTVLSTQSQNAAITELGLRIVDQAEISELNSRYRQKEGPTNVLSFPFELPPGFPEDSERTLLGDIVICSDIVEQEATQQNKTSKEHWAHMSIHGTFHLLGYDHIDDHNAEEMETLEIKALAQLGFPNPYLENPNMSNKTATS